MTIDLPGGGSATLTWSLRRDQLGNPAMNLIDVVRRAIDPAIDQVVFDLREFATGRVTNVLTTMSVRTK